MAAFDYAEAIRRVFLSEGGYVNHPSDPGGETNYGITIAVARANGYSGSMRALTLETAKAIYKKEYADKCGFDDLPAGLDYAVLDYAVNSGVSRANKVLRRVINLADNAAFSQVLGQLSTRDTKAVISAVDAERLKFLQSLRTWPTFGPGWGRRVQSVNAAALKMAALGDVPIPSQLPPVADPAPGKGVVPKPKTAVPTIAASVPTGAVGISAWIATHPFASAAIVAGVVVAAIIIAEIIARRWQASKQDAPTPGLIPVPASA